MKASFHRCLFPCGIINPRTFSNINTLNGQKKLKNGINFGLKRFSFKIFKIFFLKLTASNLFLFELHCACLNFKRQKKSVVSRMKIIYMYQSQLYRSNTFLINIALSLKESWISSYHRIKITYQYMECPHRARLR